MDSCFQTSGSWRDDHGDLSRQQIPAQMIERADLLADNRDSFRKYTFSENMHGHLASMMHLVPVAPQIQLQQFFLNDREQSHQAGAVMA